MNCRRLSAKAMAAALVVTVAMGMSAQQAAAEMKASAPSGNAVQDLKSLPRTDAALKAYAKRYFSQENSCGDHDPETMPAKRICGWTANPEEDWPDLLVAIEQGKNGAAITSAVVMGENGEQPLGAGWQCQMTTYGPSRICFPKGTPAARQKKAAEQWNRYLNAAN